MERRCRSAEKSGGVGREELVRIQRPENCCVQTQQYGRCGRADQSLQLRCIRIFTAANWRDDVEAARKIPVEVFSNGVDPWNGYQAVCRPMLLVAGKPGSGEHKERLLPLLHYLMLNYFHAEYRALAQDGPEIRGG